MARHANSDARDDIVEVGRAGSLAVGLTILALLALVPALFASPGDRAVLFPVVALLASAAVAFAAHRPLRRRTPVNITLDGETVVIERANGRTRRVPRSRIERVELKLPHDGHPEVLLIQRWVTVRLEIADHALARDIVSRLCEQRASATYWARPPLAHLAALSVAYLVALAAVVRIASDWVGNHLETAVLPGVAHVAATVGDPFLTLVLLAAGIPLALVALPIAACVALYPKRRITLGRDGIEVRWMGLRRYVRFTQIEDVRLMDTHPLRSGAELHISSGDVILATMHRGPATSLVDALRTGMGPTGSPSLRRRT